MATTLDSLAAKHPKSTYLPTADYMRYRADMKLSDTNRAAARLSSIVDKGETHPYYTTAIIERASLYRRTSKWDAARKDYETYIKLADDPKNNIKDLNETLVDLQDTYIRLGELKLAGQTATRLLATAKLPPLLEQQTLFRHALVLIKTKKLAEAATTLKQLATKHPQNEFIGQVHYYNGLLLMAAGKTDDAAKQLQASLGDQKLPRKLRAQALLLVSIRQRERNEDDNAATTLAALKKAIGLDRMRTDDLLWLAKYYVDREPGSVFLYTEQLIDGKRKVADDKRTIALFLTGRALQSSTDQEGINAAIQSFKEVEALGHGYGILARLEIARTQARAGKRDESLRNYKGLMTVKDSTIAGTAIYEAAQVHRQMAAQKEAFSDTVGAKAEYKEAYNLFYRLTVLYGFKELSPLPELAHIQRAELATKVDKPDDNSKSLNELLKRFPQGPYAIYAKAMQAMNTKKDTEAANLLRSLRQKKTDPRLAARIHTRLRELEGSK
jgi:tetratricopeptide (TPR) repeat protein